MVVTYRLRNSDADCRLLFFMVSSYLAIGRCVKNGDSAYARRRVEDHGNRPVLDGRIFILDHDPDESGIFICFAD